MAHACHGSRACPALLSSIYYPLNPPLQPGRLLILRPLVLARILPALSGPRGTSQAHPTTHPTHPTPTLPLFKKEDNTMTMVSRVISLAVLASVQIASGKCG